MCYGAKVRQSAHTHTRLCAGMARQGSRQVFFKFNKVMNCLQKYKEKFTNVSFVGFLRYLCNENEGER